MKVKELIAALQLCDQELEVYGYCDHGQAPQRVCGPSVIRVQSVDHTLWDNWDANDEYDYEHKAILL